MKAPRSVLLIGLGGLAYAAAGAAGVAWSGLGEETASVALGLLLLLPAAFAVRSALAAGARSGEAERVFWSLLAVAAATAGCGAALFAVWKALWPAPVVAAAAHACSFAWPVLCAVACLLRPDRARPRRQAVWAALDAGVGVLLASFCGVYLFLLPAAAGRQSWAPGLILQQALPTAVVTAVAVAARRTSFAATYAVLAAALMAVAAATSLVVLAPGAGAARTWPALVPVLPLAAIAATARWAPASRWLRGSWLAPWSAPPPLIAAAVAVPPLFDLLARAATEAPPRLAAQRTELALATAGVLALLVAVRVRGVPAQRARPPLDADDARLALGEPNPYLQFTSGVAHEVNNPLTAVSGWAELSLHAAVDAQPLRELLAATRAAAEGVQQLQRAAREMEKGG